MTLQEDRKLLLQLAKDDGDKVHLFRSPQRQPYADVEIDKGFTKGRVTLDIYSQEYEDWLRDRFHETTGDVPSSISKQVIKQIAKWAMDSRVEPVFMRVGMNEAATSVGAYGWPIGKD